VLGQGGFGITYLARDTNLDRAVAIKEYLPVEVAQRRSDGTVRSRTETLGERYRWGLERFIGEAQTLAQFDHPSIVRVHAVFEAQNTAYMVMRFEEGENLGRLLERRGTLPETELLQVLFPILDGLQFVHDANFIHRDIKPENIHLREDGSPVLLDFGSARQSLNRNHTMTVLVARGYAPLEQYYGTADAQGPWTDIYSLAATCYRAISGQAPADALERIKGVLGSVQEVLVPASEVGRGRYSPQLLKAIDHALEMTERDRPQSIAEWRKELPALSIAMKPGPSAAGLISHEAKIGFVTHGNARNTDAGSKRKTRVIYWGASLLFVLLVVGSLYQYLPYRDAQPDSISSPPATFVAARQDEPTGRPSSIPLSSGPSPSSPSSSMGEPPQDKLTEPVPVQAASPTQATLTDRGLSAARAVRVPAPSPAARKTPPKAANAKDTEGGRYALVHVKAQETGVVDTPPPSESTLSHAETVSPAPKSEVVPEPPKLEAAPAPVPKQEQVGRQAAVAPTVEKWQSPEPSKPDTVAPPKLVTPKAEASTSKTVSEPARKSGVMELLEKAQDALGKNDYVTALPLLRRLSAAGEPHAQALLGGLYERGAGIKQNTVDAYMWYSLAAKSGSGVARTERERVAANLQAAEIRQADRAVDKWKPVADEIVSTVK
jgi:serine/threonine protein kinase